MADISGISTTVTGSGGSKKTYISTDNTGETYELYIVSNNVIYAPVAKDGVIWSTTRSGAAGSLKFTVVKDDVLSFLEGDTVIFKYGGVGVFYGYVFTKSRDKDGLIEVLAYDQLRYFKNKDTYLYENKRADELFLMLIEDFKLNAGTIENTGYVIANRIEDNAELFDIIENAIDETYNNTGKLYFIYDDFGKLCLRDISTLKADTVLNEDTAEDYSYSSSIDNDVYNVIQIYEDDKDSGQRKKNVYQDGTTVSSWGVLQLTQKLGDDEDADTLGQELLNTHNRKKRELSVKKAFGDILARAGAKIAVSLTLGDIEVNSYLTIEKATHTFKHGSYFMDLELELI